SDTQSRARIAVSQREHCSRCWAISSSASADRLPRLKADSSTWEGQVWRAIGEVSCKPLRERAYSPITIAPAVTRLVQSLAGNRHVLAQSAGSATTGRCTVSQRSSNRAGEATHEGERGQPCHLPD